jgi:hypothetical protein
LLGAKGQGCKLGCWIRVCAKIVLK